jgi:hypothetical protein
MLSKEPELPAAVICRRSDKFANCHAGGTHVLRPPLSHFGPELLAKPD